MFNSFRRSTDLKEINIAWIRTIPWYHKWWGKWDERRKQHIWDGIIGGKAGEIRNKIFLRDFRNQGKVDWWEKEFNSKDRFRLEESSWFCDKDLLWRKRDPQALPSHFRTRNWEIGHHDKRPSASLLRGHHGVYK